MRLRLRLGVGVAVVAFLAAAMLAFSVTLVASGAPSALSFTRIAAGNYHTCALTRRMSRSPWKVDGGP